ncbi:hypothetical protein Tco_0351616 [Tanacetum coccineum]
MTNMSSMSMSWSYVCSTIGWMLKFLVWVSDNLRAALGGERAGEFGRRGDENLSHGVVVGSGISNDSG